MQRAYTRAGVSHHSRGLDSTQREYEEYTRQWCIKSILTDTTLWDMRFWPKPKYDHTKAEIIEQITDWVVDLNVGVLFVSCSSCVAHMSWLLDNKYATVEELADYVMRNPYIRNEEKFGIYCGVIEPEDGKSRAMAASTPPRADVCNTLSTTWKDDSCDIRLFDQSYCLRHILYDPFMWDMRCWRKPKEQYSKQEVVAHLKQWIRDQVQGRASCTCYVSVFCMRQLLEYKWATIDYIATVVLRNTCVTYKRSIGTWCVYKEGIYPYAHGLPQLPTSNTSIQK